MIWFQAITKTIETIISDTFGFLDQLIHHTCSFMATVVLFIHGVDGGGLESFVNAT